MQRISLAARTLFPVSGRAAPRAPRRAAGTSLLQQLLAVAFAAAPLVVMIDAVARTA